jgi:hypothetical protein
MRNFVIFCAKFSLLGAINRYFAKKNKDVPHDYALDVRWAGSQYFQNTKRGAGIFCIFHF